MALLDISIVTRCLRKFLGDYFTRSSAWSGVAPVISPRFYENINAGELGLYLYHLSEDAHFKNLPPPGRDDPPVRYAPMGLNLYYQLTARGSTDDEEGTFQEQQMIGIAAKAFHDYPVIDNTTSINGYDVFPITERLHDDLEDNQVRIVLQPVPYSEAVSYWTAGDTPLRLAAYYQVSVVLLEPEESKSRAGRVLTYGVHAFVAGAPRLDSSQNTLSFLVPGATDPREVELRPAQVPVGSQVTFTGSGLVGDSISLLLRNSRWDEPVEADLAWGVAVGNERVSATVQETASGEDVLPGIYAAIVKVTKRRTLSDGSVRDFEHFSNASPFAITPRIDNIGTAGDVVTVEGFVFGHSDLTEEAVQVYLGETRLTRRTATGPLDPGEFAVVDPPPPPPVLLPTLQLRLPAGLTSGQFLPLRIFVNGAESPPNWIEV